MRVGLDIVAVGEVAGSIARFGERYLSRVFTAGERRACGGAPERLAARFAAKEATMKVLRVSDEAIAWTDIEVTGLDITLRRGARDLARRRGLGSLALSMSHDGDYATAVVIAAPQASRIARGAAGKDRGRWLRRSGQF